MGESFGRIVLKLVGAVAFCVTSAHASIVVGGFGPVRGGDASLAGGSLVSQFSASLDASFPGSTVATSETLNSSYLDGIDVLILTNVRTSTSRIDEPLSAVEQNALVQFVDGGGGLLLLADNAGQDDEFASTDDSLLSPFGFDASGRVGGVVQAQESGLTRSVISGPFGSASTFNTGVPGTLSALPDNAIVAATLDAPDAPATVAVIPPRRRSATSGGIVVFSDFSLSADFLFEVGNSNDVLLKNAIDYVVSPPLAGDANGDGIVNLADFGILRANFGTNEATFATGDFTADGLVDLADFGILRANFGSTAGEAAILDAWYATVVPEPTTLVLAGVGGLLLRRRRA